MFSKSFSTVLLASTTALAACGGGGGGGGGGLPDVGDNNYFDGFSGQVSALQAQIQGASVSALVNPSQQDRKTAQEVVDLINNIDAYWANYKAELSDDVYAVKSQTQEFQEAEAIIELLKGDFLSIANTVAQGGKIDTTVIAKYSDATVVQTEIETKKKNLFHAAIEKIETVANVEVSRAVGADSNEREVVKSTTKGAETVTGGVAGNLKRVKTAEVTTVYEKLFDRTTTVILEDQRKITFADGSSRIEVVATRTKSNTQTLPMGTRTATETVTEEIAHTVAVDAPSEETITEDPVVTVDRSATYVETYTDAKGNKVTETKVKPVKTITVKRNKRVTDTKRSTYTYADGHTLVVDLDDGVTVTALDDVVTTETLAEEVVDTKVEVQLVNEETTQETTVDTVEGEPVFVTTHEDKTTVVEADGNTTTTVTRYFTTTVTTTTTTTTTVNKTTVKTFSNGTTETVVHQPEVSVETKDTVVEDKFTKIISEVVEAIAPEVVEKKVVDEFTITRSDPPVVTETFEDVTTSVVADNGDETFTTTRNYTTVTSITKRDLVTKVFDDDTVERIQLDPYTETTTDTRSEVVKTWTVEYTPEAVTVVDTVVTESEEYIESKKVYGEPNILKVEDKTTEENGYTVVTRYTTHVTPYSVYHYYTVTTTTVTKYSDGTEKTETTTKEKVNGPDEKVGTQQTTAEEISRTKIVVEKNDDGVIGEDHADMGTRTPGYVADPTHYQTDEFNFVINKQLDVSNFDVAYSRGWTGKGSTVVIADTGALTSHTDLDANISATIDFTNTDMASGAEHGTHVAGIAGAERNGEGMHGAAFDANLAIAKVSSGNFYSFANAIKAAEWGKSLGSAAINVSAEMNYDSAFRSSIVKTAPGEYYSTHWYYRENGYNGAVNEAVKWKAALGDEQVLVKAAGNAGWDYSAGMNQMATATDANGNLILDGQMIVVGNWDENNNQINSSSNKAGTVCATMQNGVCIDAAKIKDYFIMANGTQVTSTGVNGGYVTMTGTSMAAPVVTGAVAVLHQMWPHMKGKHLVQLVMVTGNKDIYNYDENVHGQGLLDMDRATRPVGATGIPTTGRTNGGVSNISGGAAIGGGVSAGQVTALTGVMLLDSFERDFYVDLSDMTQAVDTRTASVAEQMGAVNYYSGYLGEKQLAVPFALNDNSHIVVGGGESDGHALGNAFSGTLGTTEGSTTMYANYNYRNGGFYAQAGVGVTRANFDKSGSMLAGADSIVSSTATVGYEFAPKENTTWGFAVSQPVTVESAKMQYRVPTARTLDGRVVHEMRTVDFKSSERELDLGTYYNFDIAGAQVNTFAELRTNVAALQKELEKRVGLSVQYKF
jgi:subtilisin family serine protease